MPDKSDAGGQPTMEKLMAEGVSPRRCISYEGMGEYGGNGNQAGGPKAAKSKAAPAPMRKGGGGY